MTQRIELRDRLLSKAESLENDHPELATRTRNFARVLEFHRREAKPVFWKLFERLGLDPVDLQDDFDCLANCQRTYREGFKPKPKSRNLAYEYQFDPEQELRALRRISTFWEWKRTMVNDPE